MRSLARNAALAALFVVALAAVGCGETVLDDAKSETSIEAYLEDSLGRKVSAVECPSGVEVEKDATFECTVTLAGGERETATMEILNEDADIGVADLRADK
jgi:Domain of unknown function (DUF4333)